MKRYYGAIFVGSLALTLGAGTQLPIIGIGCWLLALLLLLWSVVATFTEERLDYEHRPTREELMEAKKTAIVETCMAAAFVLTLMFLGAL